VDFTLPLAFRSREILAISLSRPLERRRSNQKAAERCDVLGSPSSCLSRRSIKENKGSGGEDDNGLRCRLKN
jgi:hypothetical protein